MATITVERGEKSYRCWNYLKENSVGFQSYRIYGQEPQTYAEEFLAFDIDDEDMAVVCALKFS